MPAILAILSYYLWWIIFIIIIVAIVLILCSGFYIIDQTECGLLLVLGRYRRVLHPGLNYVPPLVSTVLRLEMRTEVIEIPAQRATTRDAGVISVNGIVYMRVLNPERAHFEVTNYRLAVVALAQTTIKTLIGGMQLQDIISSRHMINTRTRELVDMAANLWGVKVENIELRDIDVLQAPRIQPSVASVIAPPVAPSTPQPATPVVSQHIVQPTSILTTPPATQPQKPEKKRAQPQNP